MHKTALAATLMLIIPVLLATPIFETASGAITTTAYTIVSSGNLISQPYLADPTLQWITITKDTTNYYANSKSGKMLGSNADLCNLVNPLIKDNTLVFFDEGVYTLTSSIKVSENIKTVFCGTGKSTILSMASTSNSAAFSLSSSGSTLITSMSIENPAGIKQKLIQLTSPAENVKLTNLYLDNEGPSSADAINAWGYPTPIENLEVTNCQFTAPQSYGIYLHYSHNVTVSNCHFLKTMYGAVGSTCQSEQITVENNIVDWSNDTAFDFEIVDKNYPNFSTASFSISANTIASTGGASIYCMDAYNGVISKNTILNATGTWSKIASINVGSTTTPCNVSNIIISDNIISQAYNGIYVYGQEGRVLTNTNILDNSITNCQFSGILVGGYSSNCLTQANKITDTSLSGKGLYDGITNRGGDHCTFTQNYIRDSTGYMRNGFWESWYDYNIISNNTFELAGQQPINITSGLSHDTIINNVST